MPRSKSLLAGEEEEEDEEEEWQEVQDDEGIGCRNAAAFNLKKAGTKITFFL